jgi:uncharacterized protein (TIGR02996 family)
MTPAEALRLREALESALAANPDDLGAHMAYADLLTEQGDPWGEFIRAQIAEETLDRSRSALPRSKPDPEAERRRLGELAPFLLDRPAPRSTYRGSGARDEWYSYGYARGWLSWISAHGYGCAFTRALASSPQARLLRSLALGMAASEAPEEDEPDSRLPPGCTQLAPWLLLGSPTLGHVRRLSLGSGENYGGNCPVGDFDGRAALALVRSLPNLEELLLSPSELDAAALFSLPMPCLRRLVVDGLADYPLERLAENESLGRLEEFRCHTPGTDQQGRPCLRLEGLRAFVRSEHLRSLRRLYLRVTFLGDEGVREIVESGVLKRLSELTLRNGTITDAGAKLLAGCPEVRHLELIDLERNCLSEEGVSALRELGIHIGQQWQPTGNAEADRWAMYEGDME